ncbi:MAG: alpha/beta hydrolase [Promethearchaeota archaeon]
MVIDIKTIQTRFKVLLISIILIFGGIGIAWVIQNDFGTVITKEIELTTSDNVIIHSTLQIPHVASESNPVPGVVVIHGVYQSKEWLMAFSIELARRNFVVLTIDAASHGNSGYASYDSDRGGAIALEYLNDLNLVDKLGIVGHSMGAGIAIQALELTSVSVDAVVFVGGGSHNLNEWANTTYPHNLLLTVGRYDELYDDPNMFNSLSDPFGAEGEVVTPGVLYGDFSNGSARKIILGETNHLFETIDPIIISETIRWLGFSLKETEISTRDLIYQFHILGGFLACIGILLSIFPIITILLESTSFNSLKCVPSSKYAISTRGYFGLGLIYSIIGLGSFLPSLILPSFPFPQSLGSKVGIWLLGSSIIAFLILTVIFQYQRKEGVSLKDYGIDNSEINQSLINVGKSFLIAIIIIVWLYLWVIPVDLLLALDFRAFLPLLNDLTLRRLVVVPLYLLFTIPFFLVEGLWIIGLLRTQSKNNWTRTRIEWTIKAVFIKCFPYASIILLQLIESYLLGSAYISGMIGFFLLFLWMFTPFFIISTVILMWSYQTTERIYIGVFLNSLIFSWTMASILTLAM